MQAVRTVTGRWGLLLLWAGLVFARATDQNVCSTQACEELGKTMKSNMDTSVEPCDDFYEYACGGWRQRTAIPPDTGFTNILYRMSRQVVDITRKMITAPPDTNSQSDLLSMPRMFYQACMNSESIEAMGGNPLKTVVESVGGWPMIQPSWSPDTFSLTDLLTELGKIGANCLFGYWPIADMSNFSRLALTVTPAGWFGIGSYDAYFTDTTASKLVAYKQGIRAVVKAMSGSEPSDEDVEDMVNFEMEIVNISTPRLFEQPAPTRNNRYTVKGMDEKYPMIQWSRFFRGLFSNEKVNIDIPDNELVINHSPDYFTRLNNLVQGTDKKTLANLIMWRFVYNWIDSLSSEFKNISFNMEKEIYGTQAMQDREESCVEMTTDFFRELLGYTYLTKHFPEANNTKTEVNQMIDGIKEAFRQRVGDADWMDDDTKSRAIEKNNQMLRAVAYSDTDIDLDHINEIYQDWEIKDDQYFNNMLSAIQQSRMKEFKKLREYQDRREFSASPMSTNAFYRADKNGIIICAGILFEPMFNIDHPRYIKYGGIGMVIGHEITHGFDNIGRHYDEYGNAVNWWTNSSDLGFTEKAECFINQYTGFYSQVAKRNLNGRKTQGENIADAGGIQLSFKAYKNWVQQKNNGEQEKRLPHVDLNTEQLFFLNFAQAWCENVEEKKAQTAIENNEHSLNRFRVIGALQNFEEFSTVFNCAPGTYMNPGSEDRCEIW